MSERRKPVDQSHTSLAMLAAAQTGRPFEHLLFLPDEELLTLITLPNEIEPLSSVGEVFADDGRVFPHRRGTTSRTK